MARRNRQNRATTQPSEAVQAMRRAHWLAKTEAMAEGRRERAATYGDRRRINNRRACRDRNLWG
jgi:hypothetical protein